MASKDTTAPNSAESGRWGRALSSLLLAAFAVAWAWAVYYFSVSYLRVQLQAGQSPWPSAVALVGLFVLALAGLKLIGDGLTRQRRAAEPDAEQPPPEGNRRAILLVHGMGVQDRYQFLTDFKKGLVGFAGKYRVKEIGHETWNRDSYPLDVRTVDADKNPHIVDLYEAYWGHFFNGVTNWKSASLFGLKTVATALPTLFSRVFPKRLYDLIWIASALGIGATIIFGVYGGFRLNALRMEYFQNAMDGQYGPAISPQDMDPTLTYTTMFKNTGERISLPGTTRPNFDDRARIGRAFLVQSFTSLFGAMQHSFSGNPDAGSAGVLIPITKPFKNLTKFPTWNIVMAVVYCVGLAMLMLNLIKFALAQLSMVSGALRVIIWPKVSISREQRVDKWRTETHEAVYKAFPAALVVLAIFPNLDIVLYELFGCAAVLWITYAGFKWWMDNFLGDVQIYATYDENSTTWDAREKASEFVKERLVQLLDDTRYDRVVLVGHSLGSAVALNAVRRLGDEGKLVRQPNKPYLSAFFTIGSPLRKFRQLFRTQSYKWAFSEFNVQQDRRLFIGEGLPPCGDIPWYNYWFSSDIFADRLAYIPLDKLENKLKAIDTKAISPAEKIALRQQAIDEAKPGELDRTGYPIGGERDVHLGFRLGVWTHSDYWFDARFVDALLDETLAFGENPTVATVRMAEQDSEVTQP